MEFPEDLKYSKQHEWVLLEGNIATIGITDFAQDSLGDIVFVELPAVGDKVSKEDAFGVVESVKAVSSLYSPVDGEVLAVNTDLPGRLEKLGDDPYQSGWMIKVALSGDATLSKLMDASAYEKQCAAEG